MDKPKNQGERDELMKAERAGKARSKGEDPQLHKKMGD